MKKILLLIAVAIFAISMFKNDSEENKMPLIAIANYGQHSSLYDSIIGIKEQLKEKGYIEGQNISYYIEDVGFNPNLIAQMITKLKAKKPTVMIAMTTPVAQYAKHNIKDIPLIYNVITDPIEAGLLRDKDKIDSNATCASDMQDLDLLLNFAKKILPNSKRIGVLYSTSEANDAALVKMLAIAAAKFSMEVVAISIDQAIDVPLRMQGFKDKVDFIYVGTSGPIQPTLPAIVTEADKMGIPIFNVNEDAVQKNQVLASFGVNYVQVGKNTGKIVANILDGEGMMNPVYPGVQDHFGFISRKKAKQYKIKIPSNLENVTIVE